MPELLLATRNRGKTREFGETLGTEFQVTDLSELAIPEIEESGKTFEENAILKAMAVSNWLAGALSRDGWTARQSVPAIVVADDSGLEVDSLGGAPGVYSARYAGANASDEENVRKLLRELHAGGASAREPARAERGVAALRPPSGGNRRARFVCVLALVRDTKLVKTFRGEVEGVIVDRPRGTGGFGYDPIFQPNGFDQTFAELAPAVKHEISHRGRAIAQLREYLRSL